MAVPSVAADQFPADRVRYIRAARLRGARKRSTMTAYAEDETDGRTDWKQNSSLTQLGALNSAPNA